MITDDLMIIYIYISKKNNESKEKRKLRNKINKSLIFDFLTMKRVKHKNVSFFH